MRPTKSRSCEGGLHRNEPLSDILKEKRVCPVILNGEGQMGIFLLPVGTEDLTHDEQVELVGIPVGFVV